MLLGKMSADGKRWMQSSEKLNQTVGLSSEYKDKSCEIGKWLSQFFGLPFLPAEEIEDCFVEDIMSEAPSLIMELEGTVFDYINSELSPT
jgi:hypothetical protein